MLVKDKCCIFLYQKKSKGTACKSHIAFSWRDFNSQDTSHLKTGLVHVTTRFFTFCQDIYISNMSSKAKLGTKNSQDNKVGFWKSGWLRKKINSYYCMVFFKKVPNIFFKSSFNILPPPQDFISKQLKKLFL